MRLFQLALLLLGYTAATVFARYTSSCRDCRSKITNNEAEQSIVLQCDCWLSEGGNYSESEAIDLNKCLRSKEDKIVSDHSYAIVHGFLSTCTEVELSGHEHSSIRANCDDGFGQLVWKEANLDKFVGTDSGRLICS